MKRSALACVLLLAPSVVAASDVPSSSRDPGWPRWRGAAFDGTATTGRRVFARDFSLTVRWKRPLGGGYSGIAVQDGHAVTMFTDGTTDYLVSFSSDTGREEWRRPLGPAFPARDGSTGGPVSTPAIDDGVVYALGPRGDLLAVGARDGAPLWKRQLVSELGAAEPHWGFTTSPLVTDRFVIVLTGGAPDKAITALDRKTGATAWRTGSDDASYQSPLLAEGRLIAGGDKRLVALDPRDGRELWSHEHGGNGFYARILNPVVTAPGELFLTYRNDESVLLRVATRPDVAWTTKELKLNYATPIAWNGLVFGYSGRFLSCVDARTGALKWRSRAPGDGFPIVVDDHLVVLTKEGTLAVAPASAEGYAEKAALSLFSRLAWTPPSFAEGRIFARDSYGEIAAVDVVPAKAPLSAPAASATEASSGLTRRVNDWLEGRASSPIVEDDRFVTIFYRGPETDVALRGDWLETNAEVALRRVPGTDVQYASLELAPDARIAYQLAKSDGTPLADPANPAAGESLSYAGPVSLLYMPKAERPAAIAATDLRGRIEDLEIEADAAQSAHLKWGGGKRKVRVYLPPGYDAASERRYPTLYVLYGDEMMEGARLAARLDREIGSSLRPLVAVFIPSTSPYEYARTFQDAHRTWLAERVVPAIDGRFRTSPEAKARALFGVDEAGFAAVDTPLRLPKVFGNAVAQSVFPVGQGAEELLALVDGAPKADVRFYLDWGRYDPHRKSDLLDVPAFTRTLAERLRARGYAVESREWPDGSALAFWGARAMPGLRTFFGPGDDSR